MSTTNDTVKDLVNVAYNSALIAGGVTLSRMVTSQFMKDRPIKPSIKSVGMLSLEIGVSNAVVGMLQKNGMLPKVIMT